MLDIGPLIVTACITKTINGFQRAPFARNYEQPNLCQYMEREKRFK